VIGQKKQDENRLTFDETKSMKKEIRAMFNVD